MSYVANVGAGLCASPPKSRLNREKGRHGERPLQKGSIILGIAITQTYNHLQLYSSFYLCLLYGTNCQLSINNKGFGGFSESGLRQ